MLRVHMFYLCFLLCDNHLGHLLGREFKVCLNTCVKMWCVSYYNFEQSQARTLTLTLTQVVFFVKMRVYLEYSPVHFFNPWLPILISNTPGFWFLYTLTALLMRCIR